jgi:hypothetical protein
MAFLPAVTIDGRACWLLLWAADWRVRPKVAHQFATLDAEAGTGIEANASEHHAVRLTQTIQLTLGETAAMDLLTRLQALAGERFAVPIARDTLPAAEYAARRLYLAGHTVNFNEVTAAYQVDGDGGHPTTAGLLIGRLANEPEIVARTDLHATLELVVEDDSPWASRVQINTLAAPTWTWVPEWNTEPRVSFHTQQERRRLGQGRESAYLRPEAPRKRVDRATFLLDGRDDMRRLLTFWSDKRGPLQPFSVPAWFHPGYDEGAEPVLNVRFADETLVLDFLTDEHARFRAGFRQQLQLAEGQPSQARPSRAALISVWWEGSAMVNRWSDWESPLVHDGNTYQPAIVEVQRSNETLRPGETEWDLLVADYAGNPLRAFALLAIERRLMIEIRECDPTNAAAAVLVFTGQIKKAPRTGQIYAAKCALFGGVLRHLVPNYFCQTSCNHTLYDDLCGVSEAANKVTGAVAAVNGTQVDVSGAAAAAADWFASGFAVFGVGDDIELRFILRSAPHGGGQRLTLHRPLFALGVGAAVDYYPGCDGQFEGGCVKFANQDNYGGFPYKPDYIESVNTGFKAKTGK